MEAREWMKHPVHGVKPLDSIHRARELMEKHRVNQLPVLVDGQLVGIVTDRDLRDAFPSVFDAPVIAPRKARVSTSDPRTVKVEMVMTSNVTTAAPGDTLPAIVRVMRGQRIGAVPVVEKGRIVGIITRSDILAAFLALAESQAPRNASRAAG